MEKILSGEKRLEFRRRWAREPVDTLVIYATSPVKMLVATARVERIITGTKTSLWKLAQQSGGGVSRRELFQYLNGKKSAVAIEMSDVELMPQPIDPKKVFGDSFSPPQSFIYLSEDKLDKVRKYHD